MMTNEEIMEKRNAFAVALEEAARLAATVPYSNSDIPPKYIRAELIRFARNYRIGREVYER